MTNLLSKNMIKNLCLVLFAIGTVLRIALVHHWHSVSPHAANTVTGHTYALSGGGGTVFVTPLAGHVLETLYVLPPGLLLVGMLVWARNWREFK